MNTRRRNVTGSLELLLDTICNTFGGVVFISLLVVMLVNMTGQAVQWAPPDGNAQAELARLEGRLQDATARLASLRAAREQQEAIARQLADEETRQRIGQLQLSRDRQALLSAQHDAALLEISQAQREVNRIAQSLQALEKSLARARTALAAARKRLEEEIVLRSRTAELPRLRPTRKQEVAFFLKAGRLCAYARRDSAGRLVPNPEEFDERRDANGQTYIEPRIEAGLPVALGAQAGARIAERLRPFDREQHFLTIFVWPDSFAHFATVKQQMVALGFEYHLVPFPAQARVYLGSEAAPALVQ